MLSETPLKPTQFASFLSAWQAKEGRHNLPWQIEPTAYSTFISEMMLQQTQVKTVIGYFERWMARLPDLKTLADASLDEVMYLWQGLGYYQRAKRIHAAAQYIQAHHQGHFPKTLIELRAIPGIGPYTAGAIMSFAYDAYGPIVDGNVRRFFCRYFGIEGLATQSKVDKQLWSLSASYTPECNNRKFAQSLLDMGALVCTPKNTKCNICPVQKSCYASQKDKVSELPTKKPPKKLPKKDGYFIWHQENHRLKLIKRPNEGTWANLWCLPHVEAKPKKKAHEAPHTFKHKFTHYQLEASVYKMTAPESSDSKWYTFEEIEQLGLPAPIKKIIQTLNV